jgi:hypothetical protein
MRARHVPLLCVVAGLAASCGGDDAPDPAVQRQLAKFDYAVRLSIACRRADVRLARVPAAASAARAAPVARRWQTEAHRLALDLLDERFPPHVQAEAEAVRGPADVLASRLSTLAQALARERVRASDVRALTDGVRESGRLLRAGARALDANACKRVDAAAERRLLPGLRRPAGRT